ncbi:MAG: nitrous oxide reductase family maturation protein NosD [Candidatus Hodarchaeota archaeon]
MKNIKNIIISLLILIIALNVSIALIISKCQFEFRYNEKKVKIADYIPVSPIVINNNADWNTLALTETWCHGSGTGNDPYIIEGISIDGLDSSTCISISNSDVFFIIRNCLFTSSGRTTDGCGIGLYYVDNGILSNNDCSNDNAHGIEIRNSNNISILDNQAHNNEWTGINLVASSNITVSNNVMNNNDHMGIYVTTSHGNLISDNTAKSNYVIGIRFYRSNNNTIFKNEASTSGTGIYLYDSHYNNLSENIAGSCIPYGIDLMDSNNNTISKNYMHHNRYGLTIYQSNYNIITGNTFKCNNENIYEENSVGNIIENNIYKSCPPSAILGYNIWVIISIIGIISIIIAKKLKNKSL